MAEAKRQMAGVVHDDIELAVTRTRQEAEELVASSLDRFTRDAQAMVHEVAAAIDKQRAGAVTDLGQAAAEVRQQMWPVLLWVAIIVGSSNLAGILLAAWLVQGR